MLTKITLIHCKEYLKDAQKLSRHLISVFALFLIILFFYTPILLFLREKLVDPILSGFSRDKISEYFLEVLFFLMFFYLTLNLLKKRIPTPKSLINSFFFIFFYLFFFRNSPNLEFYDFSFLKSYYYADVFVFCLIVLFLRFKNYRRIQKDTDQDSFFEDRLYELYGSDFLSRKNFANGIAYHISDTLNEKAFSISIIGNWGSGKTIFLDFLEDELSKDKRNEIIKFNPWKATDSNLMINDFFSTLSNKIKKYDINGSNEIRSYGKYLSGMTDGVIGKIIDKLIHPFTKDLTATEKYEYIESSIAATGKKFIVFIDDSDRLTGKELIQVLKLIRNTANFKNVIFLAALDTNYAISALKNTKDLAFESEYLEKIFQLEVVLPPVSKQLLYNKVLELLGVDKMPVEEKEEFVGAFRYIFVDEEIASFFFNRNSSSGLFQQTFTSLRDVVRFVNSFKIRYRILKGEIDLYDLIILEMIKLKSISIYNLLSQKKIISFREETTPDQYCLNEDAYNKLYETPDKSHNLDLKSKDDVKRLLDSLLSFSDKYKTSRSIIYPLNFSIYINYQLYNNISLKEFRVMRDKTDDEFYNWVNNEYLQGKDASISSILGSFYEFDSIDQFKKFLLLFLRIAKRDNNFFTHVVGILKGSDEVVKRYFDGDSEAAAAYLKALFVDSRIPDMTVIEIGSIFTREAFEYNKELYFSQATWQDIVLNAFVRYKTANMEIRNVDSALYVKNWQGLTAERKIIIYQPASDFYRQCVDKDKAGYLKRTLRPYYSPPSELFTFDPFIDYIFGSQPQFEAFLNGFTSEDRLVGIVKKYYPIYRDNQFREFVISDRRDHEFILAEIKKLE